MTVLEVRVRPGARRTELVGRMANGALKVAVTAPPERGRANGAVIALLSDMFEVDVTQVRVLRGATSRTKTIEVSGPERADLDRRIDAMLALRSRREADGE